PPSPPTVWRDTRACLKAALRALIPPILVPLLRRVYHGRGGTAAITKRVLRAALPPLAYAGLRSGYRTLVRRRNVTPMVAEPPVAPAVPVSPPSAPPVAWPIDPLAHE